MLRNATAKVNRISREGGFSGGGGGQSAPANDPGRRHRAAAIRGAARPISPLLIKPHYSTRSARLAVSKRERIT